MGTCWEKEYGDTTALSRASGNYSEDTGVVAGVKLMCWRLWLWVISNVTKW
nr:hypothetical protein [Halomonas sp. N3-2A]